MADDVNLYSYVGNSPVMFTDPLGLEGLWYGENNDEIPNNLLRNTPLTYLDNAIKGKYIIARSYRSNDLTDYKDEKGNTDYKKFDKESMFAKAARTKYRELIKQGISPENIIMERIDCVKTLEAAWKRREQLGNIMGMNVFSHGTVDEGPEVASGSKGFWMNGPSQLNWNENAEVVFHGCNTAKGAEIFSQSQGVTTYGQNSNSSFSSNSKILNFKYYLRTKYTDEVYLYDYEKKDPKYGYTEGFPLRKKNYYDGRKVNFNLDGLGIKYEY